MGVVQRRSFTHSLYSSNIYGRSTLVPWRYLVDLKSSNIFANFDFFPKLWTAVYPPRMAPFGLKLWENAFQTIPDISFFDVEKKNRRNFRIENSVFRYFGQVFEEQQPNGPQNLLARQIFLQKHLSWGLYDRKSWKLGPGEIHSTPWHYDPLMIRNDDTRYP